MDRVVTEIANEMRGKCDLFVSKYCAMFRLAVIFILCVTAACSTGRFSHGNRLKFVRVAQQDESWVEKAREIPAKELRLTEEDTGYVVPENIRESHEILREEIRTLTQSEPLLPDCADNQRAFSSWRGFGQKPTYVMDKHNKVRKKDSDPILDAFFFMMDEDPWVILLTLVVVTLLILGLIYLPLFTTILITLAKIALLVAAIVVLILLIVGFCNDFQAFWNR